jgi:GNAT superfamily N-acetyltransferase
MQIREAIKEDLLPLLELYTQLHGNDMPKINTVLENLWNGILADRNHHIIIGVNNNDIVSSCVLIVVPNLTHNQRPYALIENVITHKSYRGKGYATAILDFAREIAVKENCYKIMLLTGSKEESTLTFYEKAGYNRKDKTAFIQWLHLTLAAR